MRIPTGHVVTRKSDGTKGVTCGDPWGCCLPNETPVCYDGTEAFLGTLTADLTDHGPENAIPDMGKCGVGQGAECCVFLTMGQGGFCCERFTGLRWTLLFKDGMTAKRKPTAMYPDCMDIAPKLAKSGAAEQGAA